MIVLLLPTISILLLSSFYAIILKRKVVETFIISIATIIFTIYLSGLLNYSGSLLLGYYTVIAITIASGAYIIWKTVKEKTILQKISLLQGTIILLLFLAISLYLHYNRIFTYWDEFSHWGITLKHMYIYNAFGTLANSDLPFQAYPPAISILEYFFIRSFPQFTEYPAYIATNILTFSLISPFLTTISNKNILLSISLFLLPLISVMHYYKVLMVDGILGVLFGATILLHYKYPNTKYGLIITTLLLSILTLTKEWGIILSIFALIIIYLDSGISRKQIWIPVVASILSKLTWYIHTISTNSTSPWNTNAIFQNPLQPYQLEILNKFFDAVVNQAIPPFPVSPILLAMAFLLVGTFVTIVIQKKKNHLRILRTYILTTIFFLIYTSFLLLFYLFVMQKAESIYLASFNRYIYTYISGMLLTLLIPFVVKGLRKSWKTILITAILFLSLIYFAKDHTYQDILQARHSVEETHTKMAPYQEIFKYGEISEEEKICIIAQRESGYSHLVLRYLLYPNNISSKKDLSIALQPYYPEYYDPWTTIMTAEEWIKYVKTNYTLLYTHSIDEEFRETYGIYFDNLQEHTLYKVVTDSTPTLLSYD